MKKSVIAVICFALLFAIPLASASFLGWITGKSTAQETNVTIDVGNTGPEIPFVDSISAQIPTEATYTNVIFKFMAKDHDGYGDFDNSTALAKFTSSGEITRSASCAVTAGEAGGEYRNYTCTVKMWYFDAAGTWDVNVTIADVSAATAENSTTSFTYNSLTAFVISPPTLTWPTLTPGQQNVESNNHPSYLNNTGNYASSNIQVNATDLKGTTDPTKIIYGSNFTSKISSPSCDGTAMSSSTFAQVASATLPKGNSSAGGGTAQEELYYCLDVPSSVTKQSYSTSANGAWTVKIL